MRRQTVVAASAWVLLGSALGGLGRYWLGLWIGSITGLGFPWATLLINVVGSFIIGLVAAGTEARGWAMPPVDLRAFVMVGLCGGFTTFSSFSLQTLELLQAGRQGAALAYTGASMAVCLLAVWVGSAMGRAW